MIISLLFVIALMQLKYALLNYTATSKKGKRLVNVHYAYPIVKNVIQQMIVKFVKVSILLIVHQLNANAKKVLIKMMMIVKLV